MKIPLTKSTLTQLSSDDRVTQHMHQCQHGYRATLLYIRVNLVLHSCRHWCRCWATLLPLNNCVDEWSFRRSTITSMSTQWATLSPLYIYVSIDAVAKRRKSRSTSISTLLYIYVDVNADDKCWQLCWRRHSERLSHLVVDLFNYNGHPRFPTMLSSATTNNND